MATRVAELRAAIILNKAIFQEQDGRYLSVEELAKLVGESKEMEKIQATFSKTQILEELIRYIEDLLQRNQGLRDKLSRAGVTP